MNLDILMQQALGDCRAVFDRFEAIEEENTRRVLEAFRHFQVADRHFAPTTGYGYDDISRDTLESIYARLFQAEAAIVRPQLTSGTHTLSMCLFGLLLPGDHLLSAADEPYDTLQSVIGVEGEDITGTLKEMGVAYSYVPLKDNQIDVPGVMAALRPNTRVVMLQRSRGYAWRDALQPEDIRALMDALHEKRPDIYVFVDNCYGELTTLSEPTFYGADVVAGSLIKNPGGGLAPTGGYVVGTQKAIHRIQMRLTAPGIGKETGSYAASYRPFYQGLFMAPHTVCQALKTAALAARLGQLLGFDVSPAYDAPRSDIIQALKMEEPKRLIAFCQGIQAHSPVDSFALPEPWDMPGYQDQVIMAAGTFVSGASVELSADAPMRLPYIVYLQGGLTFGHGKVALRGAFGEMQAKGLIAEKTIQGAVDLHMHSTHSDGSGTPEELARMAKEKGLGLVALTDHENLAGQRAFLTACRELGIAALSGVELDSVWQGLDVHILGYGVPLDDPRFNALVERNLWLLKEMSNILIARLSQQDNRVSLADYENYVPGKKGYFKALHYLMDRGVAADVPGVFALYRQYDVDYTDVPYPMAEEVLDAIHLAGGKAVLGHPGKTFGYLSGEDFRNAVRDILTLPFDGVECYYPAHDEEMTQFLLSLCREKGLMATCGSDYHGIAGGYRMGEPRVEADSLNLDALKGGIL